MQAYQEAVDAGLSALAAGDFRQGLEIFDQIGQRIPDDAQSLSGMAVSLSELGFTGAALGLLSYAVRIVPNSPELWANLGAAYRRAQQTKAARCALLKAYELRPDDPNTLVNLAGTYVNEGDPADGLEYAKRSVELDPKNDKAAQNLALILMELGRWAEAWPHWRRRVQGQGHQPRTYPGFCWRGETVDTLVIHGEQGLGDEVMFLAYADEAWLRPLARRLVIEVAPRLQSMVARSFPWAEVIGKPEDFDGKGDAWTSMADLPAIYNGAAPVKRSGYLKADPVRVARWKAELGEGAVLLASKGGTSRTHELNRNPPREAWAPLRAAGRRVFSIQYGPGGKRQADEIGIPWLEAAANDLEEQLAAIAACAVLVSVPQTALHFGGAVGTRTLVAVSDKPAWRYGVAGPMPWYQTVDLFRQARGEDWAAVVKRIAGAL